MRTLGNLSNTHRKTQSRRRVGRGPGSGLGKTSGRGQKGAGARSGYKRRLGYEGGQMRLFKKLPQRGFSRARFAKPLHVVNLDVVSRLFDDGEMVNEEGLRRHGLISGKCHGVKLLGTGELSKKIAGFEVDAVSAGARTKVEQAGITITLKG